MKNYKKTYINYIIISFATLLFSVFAFCFLLTPAKNLVLAENDDEITITLYYFDETKNFQEKNETVTLVNGEYSCNVYDIWNIDDLPNCLSYDTLGYLKENVASKDKILSKTEAITLTQSTTFYVLYSKPITINFYDQLGQNKINTENEDYLCTSYGGVHADPTFTLPKPDDINGHTFDGWNDVLESTTTKYKYLKNAPNTQSFAENTDLYAVFKPNNYTLTLIVGDRESSETLKYGDNLEEFLESIRTPTKAADDWHTYSFSAWLYQDTKTPISSTNTISGDTVLVAEFDSHFRITSKNLMIFGIGLAVIALFVLIGVIIRRTYKQSYL